MAKNWPRAMGEELEVSEGQKGPSQWEKDEEPEAEERDQDVICVPVKRVGHSFHSLTLGEGTRRRLERCELSRERASFMPVSGLRP